jgi:hypothetical protein
MMYRYLQLKPEGAIFVKRSKPQVSDSSPHDAATSMAEHLEMNIQGVRENKGVRTLFRNKKGS